VEAFNKISELLEEIKTAQPTDAASLEAFRIRFLGTKNIIKPLFDKEVCGGSIKIIQLSSQYISQN